MGVWAGLSSFIIMRCETKSAISIDIAYHQRALIFPGIDSEGSLFWKEGRV
jgi:hypothetical protein